MKPSSPAVNRMRGFTLTELLVAATVTSIVLTSVCGIYFATAKEWEHQQGEGDALVATSRACSRLADYISQSVGAVIVTRFVSGDAIALNLPADTAYSGLYVPTWSDGIVQYRSGGWIIFYLSDTTGSYFRTGDILWGATMSWTNFPWSVVPDSNWSLYYGGKGRIRPLLSLRFTCDVSGSSPRITTVAVSAYKLGTGGKQLSVTRTVCMRYARPGSVSVQ